ncbi:MAG: hypothetical protein RR101_03185 [Burkholderiaceae bacterium]
MKARSSTMARGVALALVASLMGPALASAQTPTTDRWQFEAAIYAYLPTIGGQSSFPAGTGGSSIDVSADQIIDSLKFTFMGSLEANNGQWGVFTDLLYLNVGGSRSRTRDFSIGQAGVPANTTADLNLDIKGTVWTLVGQYRLAAQPDLVVDLLAGARLLDIKESLDWSIAGQLGPIAGPGPGRTGGNDIKASSWDAIVGAKGRYRFGENLAWSVPFYVDVGTGQSDLTWQAAAGLGYTFSWGSVYGMWRYLDYKLDSSKTMESINFNGPMIGAAFRW